MSDGKPAFRADIEGLRGIAILLVVLFHADVSAFAGGFVGVDVFFVLSGFFITALLTREIATTGEIALSDFYGRRAARLLPALLVVLAVTLAAVMWVYAPIDRAPIAGAARAVALYAGNVEFARSSVDYFSAGSNPLLHTWSLGVEEQFYLVWPLLFLLALGVRERLLSDGRDTSGLPDRRVLIAVGIAAVASFGASVWVTRVAQPWAFFGMATRIWEFAVGGALAIALPRLDIGERVGGLLQGGGLLALGIGAISYDSATPYPGIAALLPVAATAGLVVGGHGAPSSLTSRVLATSWLRWFGRMSYTWYLWHWPLIGIAAVLDQGIGVAAKLLWSTVALGLAWLTHHFVERPARERSNRLPSQWLAPLAIGASGVAALGAHGAMVASEHRVAHSQQRVFAAAREDRIADRCWATTVEQDLPLCEFGDRSSSTTLVLLGDSHAQHWLAALDRAGRAHGWKVIAMVKGGCPVADMPELMHARLKRYYHECTRYRAAMLRRIVTMRPRAVILSSWDHYLARDGRESPWQVTPAMWRSGLRRTYTRLARAGITTIAIRGTPRTWFDVPGCLSRRAAGLPFARSCVYERDRAFVPAAIRAQTEAARGLPVRFVDMNDQICSSRQCGVMRNGLVVFTDDNHLTASFSRSLAPVLGSRLEAALRH